MSGYLDDLDLSCTFKMVDGHLAVEDTFAKILQASSAVDTPKHSAGLTGTVVDSKYKVLSLLGEGGMGSVYRVLHLLLNKEMALKTFRSAQLSPDAWARFQREAQAIGKLTHPNIIQVFDFGIGEQNFPYYTMELLIGESLADRLERVSRLNVGEAMSIFIAVASGMAYAHDQGVVHRDIKPANIFLEQGKGSVTPRIVDFGLAKLATSQGVDNQQLTAMGLIFGSPLYMSPEQSLGLETDRRTDIYSFGCSLFQTLTGVPPYLGKNALATISMHQEQIPPGLLEAAAGAIFPEGLEEIVFKLLRKNPAERYQTLLEVRNDLEKMARGEYIQRSHVKSNKLELDKGAASASIAKEESIEAPATPSVIRRSTIVTATALFALAGLVALVFMARSLSSIKSTPQSTQPRAGAGISRPYGSPSEERPAPASAQYTTPYSSIVVENGHKMRLFSFPEDTTIGKIGVSHGEEASSLHEAKGRLKFAKEDNLQFRPYPIAVKYPSYLKRFAQDDIFEILVDIGPWKENRSKYYPVDEIINTASIIPGVQALNLRLINRPLTVDSISSIEQYHSLKYLYGGKALDPHIVLKLATIRQLEDLEISLPGDVAPLLERLKDSTQLKKLLLPEAELTLDGIATLASLPELITISIDRVVPSNPASTIRVFNLLCKVPHLRTLSITKLPMGPEAIIALHSFKGLKHLRCNAKKSGLNGDDRLYLKGAAAKLVPSTHLDF